MSIKARLRIAWRQRHWTKDQRVDRSFAAGLGMVAIGFGCVYWPLFFIVGGVLVASLAWKYGTAPAAAVGDIDVDDRDED